MCQKALGISANANLILHSTTTSDAIRRIGVVASRVRDALSLSFRIEGEVSRLSLPGPGLPQRTDGLWRHSCFEAFLQTEGSDAYLELNFSPSGAWAAYRFSARRRGRESPELTAPRTEVRRGPDWLVMNIQLSLDGIVEFVRAASISAGLAAVVEDEHGGLSYWALAHGAAQPDFHDPATFTLRLPA